MLQLVSSRLGFSFVSSLRTSLHSTLQKTPKRTISPWSVECSEAEERSVVYSTQDACFFQARPLNLVPFGCDWNAAKLSRVYGGFNQHFQRCHSGGRDLGRHSLSFLELADPRKDTLNDKAVSLD